MTNLYERPRWPSEARSLDKWSGNFETLAILVGAIGIIIAIVLLVIAAFNFDQGGFVGILGACSVFVQSLMLIFFALMMRGISRTLLAVFEMSTAETRDKLGTDPVDPDQADTDTDS
jgi:uncharacterized protein YacL